MPRQFQTYQHYKGGLYLKLCEARLEATDERMVVYACAVSGEVFCRSKAEFEATLEDGNPRFIPIPYTEDKAARKKARVL